MSVERESVCVACVCSEGMKERGRLCRADIVLMPAALPMDMYDAGMESIVNIDFSEKIITRMAEEQAERSKMEWLVMDITDLKFEANSFDVVLDKGA